MFSKNKKVKEVTLCISKNLCSGCGKCAAKCRNKVLRVHYLDDTGCAWAAHPDKCTGCGKCARTCPFNAIKIVEKTGVVSDQFRTVASMFF